MTKKQCPFCGARGRALEMDCNGWCPIIYQVKCTNCGAIGAASIMIKGEPVEATTRTIASRAWNRRSEVRK